MNTGGNPSGGFTIVETLIVLAVTAALFFGVAGLISGRQAKTEFLTTTQSIKQRMQAIINETASGSFPDSSNFTCLKGSPPSLTTAPNPQGTNYGCVFFGKAIHFDPGGANDQYYVYSLAANQRNNLGAEVSTLAEAQPVAVERGTTKNSAFGNGITDKQKIGGGLQVVSMGYKTSAGGALLGISVVGFLSSLSSYNNNQLTSGSQQLNLYAVKNTGTIPGAPVPLGTAVDSIDNFSNLTAAYEVDICFAGGNNQSGLLVIGGNSSQLSVNMTVKGNPTCA